MAGQTKTGKVFCLYVSRPAKDNYEKSVVTLFWDRESDAMFRGMVVKALLKPAGEGW